MAKSKSKTPKEPKDKDLDEEPPHPLLVPLGARIRVLRERRDWTQTQLGERATLSQKYLSEIERGRKALSLTSLAKLAHDAFKIDLSTLFFGIDGDFEPEVTHTDQLFAGRSREARLDVVRALHYALRAGAASSLGDSVKDEPAKSDPPKGDSPKKRS